MYHEFRGFPRLESIVHADPRIWIAMPLMSSIDTRDGGDRRRHGLISRTFDNLTHTCAGVGQRGLTLRGQRWRPSRCVACRVRSSDSDEVDKLEHEQPEPRCISRMPRALRFHWRSLLSVRARKRVGNTRSLRLQLQTLSMQMAFSHCPR